MPNEVEAVEVENILNEETKKGRKSKPTHVKVFHYHNQSFGGQTVKIPATSVNHNQIYTIEEADAVIEALKAQGIETDVIEKI